MALAQGKVFTRLVHGVLVLGLGFLVLEVHQLRVAVEDASLGYGGDDRVERLLASLDKPLTSISHGLGQVSEALGRPVMVGGDPAMPAVAGQGMIPLAAHVASPERRLVATQLESQLGSLVEVVERIDKRPKVTRASLPAASSAARGIDRQAVLKTLASLLSSPLEKSRFLAMVPKELLATYGKPTWIGIDGDTAVWRYDLSGRYESGSYVNFRLYDGRVIAVEY